MNSFQSNIKLEIKNIKKSFEETEVIQAVSIALYEGEFVSLLGLSGSGKSTIFNIASGLIAPDAGDVLIDGVHYTNKTGRISHMYQKDLLLPWRKIVDNVALPLLIKGMAKAEARHIAGGYFKTFGLEGFEEKYPFQLSGGMRQRAALMRTYLFSKDIMLLDEPFGGLDAITRSKMHTWLIKTLGVLNSSILFITHDIEEAILLSDRIYILSERPATIKEIITVNLPKPRDKNSVTSAPFNAIKRRILDLLGSMEDGDGNF